MSYQQPTYIPTTSPPTRRERQFDKAFDWFVRLVMVVWFVGMAYGCVNLAVNGPADPDAEWEPGDGRGCETVYTMSGRTCG